MNPVNEGSCSGKNGRPAELAVNRKWLINFFLLSFSSAEPKLTIQEPLKMNKKAS